MPTNQQHEQHHQNLQHHVERQEEEEIVDYDTILEHTGQMEKFQLRISLCHLTDLICKMKIAEIEIELS